MALFGENACALGEAASRHRPGPGKGTKRDEKGEKGRSMEAGLTMLLLEKRGPASVREK